MPRAKTIQFKTKLTEHVHTVSDGKGRKVPAIALLHNRDAYNTITYSTYKNKSNDAEFCILFATFINHHIDPENQKLVTNEGYSKNDTRVISKNIRHAPRIAEFFEEFEQYGSGGRKQATITIFDNPRKQDSCGFLTLTFNGGIETDDLSEDMKNVNYLHVVNGLSPTGSSGSSLVKSFPQSEFVFLEEDMDRYIQFIKDVAIHYNFLQDFNKEESSAKSVLKASLQQRLEGLEARKDGAGGNDKAEKKKKMIIEKTIGGAKQSSDPSSSQPTHTEKRKKIIKRRQKESLALGGENPDEKKRKLANALESKKKELKKTSMVDSQKGEKKDPKNANIVKKGNTKGVIALASEKEVTDSSDEKGEDGSESGADEYEEGVDVEILDDDQEEEDGEGSGSEGEDDDDE